LRSERPKMSWLSFSVMLIFVSYGFENFVVKSLLDEMHK
jgi:hypothetical protein